MFFIGDPFSSKKRTQKLHIPGPLITAPRMMFFPLLRVKREEVALSTIISLSPESIRASLPFNHHMLPELHPAASLTFFISSGQSSRDSHAVKSALITLGRPPIHSVHHVRGGVSTRFRVSTEQCFRGYDEACFLRSSRTTILSPPCCL